MTLARKHWVCRTVAIQVAALTLGVLLAPTPASAEFVWQTWRGSMPEKIVIGGRENNRDLPICRINYRNGKHPGKVVAYKCNIGWGGKEIVESRDFEVLTYRKGARATWVAASGGRLPEKTWKASRYDGGVGYVCRAHYNNGLHPGKVVAGNCNIGWGGREVVLSSYEVLLAPHRAGADTRDPGSPASPSQQIVVYQHANYQGKSGRFGLGSHDIRAVSGSVGNDQASSVRIPGGLEVTVYEHAGYKGRSETYRGDVSFMRSFNDILSSLRVRRTAAEPTTPRPQPALPDKASFTSAHGKHLVAESDGRANADRAALGSREKFRVSPTAP